MTRRFAIVGCGSIGSRHARNLRACGESFIVTIDPSRERREALATEVGGRASASLQEALSEGVDAVFVTLPNVGHLDVVRRAVEADCHLFVEKPLATASVGVVEILATARAKGLVGFLGSNFKFHPAFQHMKRLLDGGAIGRVLSARIQSGQHLPDWHPWEDYRAGYSARSELGGGVLLDSHELLYAVWLLGRVSLVACMADRLSDLEIDTEDTASLLLKMESGAQVEVHLDYTQRPPARSYEFHGTDGALEWNLRTKRVRTFTADDSRWNDWEPAEDADPNEMYLREVRHFLACIAGDERPLTPLEEGAYALRLIEAAKESSRAGSFVALEEAPWAPVA